MSKPTTANSKELALAPDAATLAALDALFPQEAGFTDTIFPRLNFKSQDVMEGVGKNKKVVIEAGTFFEERETDELNADGKKVWSKDELGTEVEGTIIFQRKQLRHYDDATEEFTSSPIFDQDTEIVPLFCNKKEIHRGTPADLKAKYAYTDPKDGKVKSKLEENRILYVLRNGELFQLNLRGSSMYSFLTFARKTKPNAFVLKMASEPQEKGQVTWNQMTFTPVRPLTQVEATDVVEKTKEIMEGIIAKKSYFAAQATQPAATAALDDDDDFQNS